MDSVDCKHESCELFILLPNNSVLELCPMLLRSAAFTHEDFVNCVRWVERRDGSVNRREEHTLWAQPLLCLKGDHSIGEQLRGLDVKFPVSSVFILEGIEADFPLLLKMMWVGSFDCYICLSTAKGLLSPRLAYKPLPDIQDSIGKCCWL